MISYCTVYETKAMLHLFWFCMAFQISFQYVLAYFTLYYYDAMVESIMQIMWNYFKIHRAQAGLGIRSFQKNGTIFALFSVLYNRTERSLRSFPFFIKEWNDLCVLFRSLEKNGTIFAFFSVIYKRTEQSLRSFPFFIKERNVLFAFISHTKIAKSRKKRT